MGLISRVSSRTYRLLDMPTYIEKSNETEQIAASDIEKSTSLSGKKPKRVIYCSDGVLEEYSTDEEDLQEREREEKAEKEWNELPYEKTDTSKVSWFDFAKIIACRNFKRTQWASFWIGECVAEMFGITTPRYASAIKQAHEEEKQRLEQEEITKQCYINEAGDLVEEQASPSCRSSSRGRSNRGRDRVPVHSIHHTEGKGQPQPPSCRSSSVRSQDRSHRSRIQDGSQDRSSRDQPLPRLQAQRQRWPQERELRAISC